MSEEVEKTLAEAITAETIVAAPARTERARFIRFLVTGGFAALANVVARIALDTVMSYELAVVLAYLVGMTTAFALARLFVFEGSTGSVHGQYARFALVNVVAFAQVWIISVGLERYIFPAIGWVWQAATLAHAIGVVSPVATSYVGHRKFSFNMADQQ